jgi:hypothetical protein
MKILAIIPFCGGSKECLGKYPIGRKPLVPMIEECITECFANHNTSFY